MANNLAYDLLKYRFERMLNFNNDVRMEDIRSYAFAALRDAEVLRQLQEQTKNEFRG